MYRILWLLLALIWTGPAFAQSCKITGITSASLSAAPLGAGTYATAQSIPVTLTVAFSSTNGIGSGCVAAFRISGILLSGVTSISGYSIASGATTVSFTTSLGGSVAVTPSPSTVSLPLNLVVPAGTYSAGSYVDATALLQAFDGSTLIGSRAVTPRLNVTGTACTINAMTAAGTLATADFSNSGKSLISTSPFVVSNLATGSCTGPTHITLRSLNGAAIKTGATSANTTATYSNFFDYTATATFSTITATLDTSSTASFSSGASLESVTSSAATSSAASGPIGITITPKGAPKLQAGSYSDTLTITLTAN